jgi:large subunit ribosomal protein L24
LIGSLNGGGTISIESARLPSLDPRAFSVAIQAADEGLPITAKKLNEVVGAALAKGDLMVPRADGAVTIVAGRATVSNLIAHGEGADLNLSGTLDLAKQTIDARLTLSGPGEGGAPGSARPDLFLRLQGRAAAPERTVDVSALVNWLMLRSLDRETRRMEAIEREKQSSTAASESAAITSKTEPANGAAAARPPKADVPPSAAPKRSEAHSLAGDHAPTLPPPMEIRPAPGVGPRSSERSSAPPRPVRPPERQNPSFLDRLLGTHN